MQCHVKFSRMISILMVTIGGEFKQATLQSAQHDWLHHTYNLVKINFDIYVKWKFNLSRETKPLAMTKNKIPKS